MSSTMLYAGLSDALDQHRAAVRGLVSTLRQGAADPLRSTFAQERLANTFALAPARTIEQKRAAAIAYLGNRWVLHPEYRFTPRHSNNPDVFPGARSRYLGYVRRLGAQARQSHPTH